METIQTQNLERKNISFEKKKKTNSLHDIIIQNNNMPILIQLTTGFVAF